MAGPKTLEHLVDVVLYLEGEKYHNIRILRAVKNRFGDISESGLFEMQNNGFIEISNPSKIFLSEKIIVCRGKLMLMLNILKKRQVKL